MKPDNRPVLQSDEWRALLRAARPHYRELARRLDTEDLSSLIGHLQVRQVDEQIGAIRLLHAAELENIPITGQQKQRLVVGLAPLMRSYPKQPGRYALILMCLIEQPVAERFLLEEVAFQNSRNTLSSLRGRFATRQIRARDGPHCELFQIHWGDGRGGRTFLKDFGQGAK